MICPNCSKEYHWCWSCWWPEGEFACSYECAVVLFGQGKISKEDMDQWEFEKLAKEVNKRMLPSRPANTLRSRKK